LNISFVIIKLYWKEKGGLTMNLKKGINLGGFLSQCVHTYEHYDSFINSSDIEKISRWGFDHVRLPIDSEVLENEDGTYNEKGFSYIDQTIEWCKTYGLSIILDIHKVAGYDFNNANDSEKNTLFNNEKLQARFLNLWKTIATRYHSFDFVAFELLNEVVETKNTEAWNDLIERAVKTIRQVAPTSIIMQNVFQN
jgi:aryl-phospho-beta-D-glucosidase BglC (GH1 family)